MVRCWVQFSDGAVTPLDLFDRSTYSLTVSTPDESVATVRRTPQSTFVVAQGEGEGQGAVVRVELRICEECQKSKRKSKLAVGMGFLQINFQSSSSSTTTMAGGGGDTDRNKNVGNRASEPMEVKIPTQHTVTSANKWLFRSTVAVQQDPTLAQTSTSSTSTTMPVEPEVIGTRSATTTTKNGISTASSTGSSNTALDDSGPENTTSGSRNGVGQKTNYGNKLDVHTSPAQAADFKEDVVKTDSPKTKSPKVIESDLIMTFRAMSNLEIGMYALVGVSCLVIFAFVLNCTSHNLCFQNHKTPIQTGLAPSGDTKDHKHDWVWLGSSSQGAGSAVAQVSTLKLPVESRKSLDSICHHTLPAVSVPAVPERTATLGRNRASSQQYYHGKTIDPNHSATLLVRPQCSEPLHSPTSKRNQVQFTTFTTLDIKHLSALKKNRLDLSGTNQQSQQQITTQAQAALADMPWPVVKPLGEPQ